MKWVRCPKCRTVNDIDRYASCDGCNADLSSTLSVAVSRPSRVSREVERDTRGSHAVLWVMIGLSAAGLFGIFTNPKDGTIFSITFLCVAVTLFTLGLRGLLRKKLGPILTIVLSLFMLGGSVFGAGVLVFFTCVAGSH